MQQLHTVGVTPDLKGLVLSARKGSKSGAYTVEVDDALLAHVDQLVQQRHSSNGSAAGPSSGLKEQAPRPATGSGGSSGRRESLLTPREIQARIRAGYLVAEVAAEAGVDIDWVERFAGPILAEQSQVLERALAMKYVAPRRGSSDLPLGESVAFVCSSKGVNITGDHFERAWSAYQLRDNNTWVVRFSYTSRRRPQHADWQVDLRGGSLEALNRPATEFGFVAKGQARRRAVAEWVVGEQRESLAAAAAEAARAPAPARITKRRTAPRSATVADDAPLRRGQAPAVATRRVKRPRKRSVASVVSGTEAAPVLTVVASRPEPAGMPPGSLPAGTAASVVGQSPGEATTTATRRRRGPSTTAPETPSTSEDRSPMRKVTSVPPVAKSTRGRPRKAAKKRAASATTRKRTTAARAAVKRTTAKRTTAKRATAKRPAARRTTAKRSTAKRATAKRSTGARKTAAKRTTAKRATAKRATAKRSTAKRATAKRSTAKRATAKRTTARRTTAKRATAKRATAKRTTARRTTAKRATAKRATAKRATAKRSTAKRATAKRATAARKTAAKRTTAKRATAKRAGVKRVARRTTRTR